MENIKEDKLSLLEGKIEGEYFMRIEGIDLDIRIHKKSLDLLLNLEKAIGKRMSYQMMPMILSIKLSENEKSLDYDNVVYPFLFKAAKKLRKEKYAFSLN